ncbi:MAG: hypothetical protein SF002_00445 [Alphaproteobacteria bacterium]|nr:hypothetical protein [Alphaproteobacteria bacterium]
MFGLPRDASISSKLDLVLDHLGLDPVEIDPSFRQAVAGALAEHRWSAGIDAQPVDLALRDAAYVLASVLEPSKVVRLVKAPTLAAHAERVEAWLRPVLGRFGYDWPWAALEAAPVQQRVGVMA